MNNINWKWVLTSFEGRLNRKPYWIALPLALAFTFASIFFSAAAFPTVLSVPIIFIAFTLLVISCVATGVKRLHDRDKSGHWLWLFMGVPLLISILIADWNETGSLSSRPAGLLDLISTGISIWMLVELGFLRGTDGPNRYGPDPLERTMSTSSPIDELGQR